MLRPHHVLRNASIRATRVGLTRDQLLRLLRIAEGSGVLEAVVRHGPRTTRCLGHRVTGHVINLVISALHLPRAFGAGDDLLQAARNRIVTTLIKHDIVGRVNV